MQIDKYLPGCGWVRCLCIKMNKLTKPLLSGFSLRCKLHNFVSALSLVLDIHSKEDESNNECDRRDPEERHSTAIVISREEDGSGFCNQGFFSVLQMQFGYSAESVSC